MTGALRVEVHGDDDAASRLAELGAGALDVRTRSSPGEPAALVVATAAGDDVDVVLASGQAAVDALWHDRLQLWAAVVHGARFESGVAVLHEHDPAWPQLARRRLRRLGEVLGAGADRLGQRCSSTVTTSPVRSPAAASSCPADDRTKERPAPSG